MPCTNCNESGLTVLGFPILTSNCGCSNCEPSKIANSSCLLYDGPPLNCSEIEPCDDLNTILSKMDAKICAVQGNYSLYATSCLAPITTEQEFVEAISAGYCSLVDNFNQFANIEFPAYQDEVNTRFLAIEQPGITCISASVNNLDSLSTLLTKYCLKFGNIDSILDISSSNWSQCFVVGSPPSNLVQGFNVILDQICQVKTLAQANITLPTFNNVGSCLPAPVTTSDSLTDTIGKIKTKLCSLPTFDAGSLVFGCTTVGTTLQNSFQNVLNQLSSVSQNRIAAVSSDFTLTPVNGSDPCQGYTLNFAGSIVDRKFALNAGDATSDYFLNKVTAGAGITFDTVTTPGTVIVKTSGTSVDEKVKSDVTDPSAGYLIDKIEGDVDIVAGLTLNVSLDTTNHKVQITPHIDMPTLIGSQLSLIASNTTLRTQFCNLVASCTDDPPAPTVGTFYASNTMPATAITVIDPGGAYTITGGSYPINPGGFVTGDVVGTASAISVTITVPHPVLANLVLYKNGVAQECIDVSGAATYTFAAVTFTASDDMTIALNMGSCPP